MWRNTHDYDERLRRVHLARTARDGWAPVSQALSEVEPIPNAPSP